MRFNKELEHGFCKYNKERHLQSIKRVLTFVLKPEAQASDDCSKSC